jgi:hypothetical protein
MVAPDFASQQSAPAICLNLPQSPIKKIYARDTASMLTRRRSGNIRDDVSLGSIRGRILRRGLNLRRIARGATSILAGLLAVAYLAPLVHSSLQGWLEAQGPTFSAFRYTEPLMSNLAEVTQTGAFVFTAGFFIGAALLLWIDYALRRRTQEMGLILVGIGLGTFVIGIGIYLFPATSAFQSASGTRSTQQPGPDEPLVWSRTPILGSTKDANGTIYAHTIGIVGKNIGAESIQLDDIYIVSEITGARIDLKVQIPNEGTIAPNETNPIPPDAFIQLSSDEFNPTAGVSEKDFLRDWGAISFVAEYGGRKHQTSFGHATVEALFDSQRPNFVPPQVSRRSHPVDTAVGAAPPMEQAVQSVSPMSGDSLKRKRELLHAYAETIDGPLATAVQQGRAISDDWNALGGLTTQQFYVQLVVFNTDMTATYARIDDLRRRFQVEDATLAGLTNWTFDKILDKTAALTTELPSLFSQDDKSARETLLDNGSFVEWAAAIDDLERWIATTRKLVADKIKVYDSVADSGPAH